MRHYIVVLGDTSAHCIGPFATQRAASDWAAAHWNERVGDPRWQVIALPDSMIGIDVHLPLRAPDSSEAQI